MKVELNHNQRYLIEEFAEDYKAHRLARRDLLKRTVLITGSIPAAAAVLSALGCGGDDDDDETATAAPTSPTSAASPTAAASVAASPSAAAASPGAAATPGAPQTEDISFRGPASDLKGYLARPAGTGTYPAVVIVHENRGLLDHFKDVARRYAGEGYVALAVDLVSRAGGTSSDANAVSGALGSAKVEDQLADMVAYVNYAKALPGVRAGGVGVTGFCFGGSQTWDVAIESPDVVAAAPYYGSVRRLDQLANTKAAILAIYGGEDTRITSQAEDVRKQLEAAGRPFEIKIYPGAQHAFFNDTNGPPRYNEAAAKDAWTLTLDWFRRHLPPG